MSPADDLALVLTCIGVSILVLLPGLERRPFTFRRVFDRSLLWGTAALLAVVLAIVLSHFGGQNDVMPTRSVGSSVHSLDLYHYRSRDSPQSD